MFKYSQYVLPTTSVFENLFLDLLDNGKKPSVFFNKIWNKDEGILELQIALAGYAKSDIKITIDKNILEVSTPEGSSILPKGDDETVKFRGLSNKKHLIKFKISEYAELLPVKFENGLLSIKLKEVIPEEKKPKSINIE